MYMYIHTHTHTLLIQQRYFTHKLIFCLQWSWADQWRLQTSITFTFFSSITKHNLSLDLSYGFVKTHGRRSQTL